VFEDGTNGRNDKMSEQHHASAQGQPSPDDQGTSAGQDELAQQLSEVARGLQGETDSETMLDELVASAVRLIPGADEGSISVVIGRRDVTSQSPSGELPQRVDAVQVEVGEGPCLDAVFQQQTVRVPDMANEQRWPRFASRAAEAGAGSMLSFQLYVEGDNLGALNLYGYQSHAFDDESEHVGLLFASHAAVAFADAQKIAQLNKAVDSRDLIGQAKGILMERYQISADQAFRVLTRASQHTNRKLRELAEELTSSGHLAGITTNGAAGGRPSGNAG
jgi:transcriptional regulator with GAF, ATPase, and Fis domain